MAIKRILSQEHKERHQKLHQGLDELVADFICHTYKLPSKTTILDLIRWSYEQTLNPTETKEGVESHD